jgi:hypothetical protein
LGQHRPVNAHQTVALAPLMEGGYVREPNNGLTRSAASCDLSHANVGARRAGARAASVADARCRATRPTGVGYRISWPAAVADIGCRANMRAARVTYVGATAGR